MRAARNGRSHQANRGGRTVDGDLIAGERRKRIAGRNDQATGRDIKQVAVIGHTPTAVWMSQGRKSSRLVTLQDTFEAIE
jgi:hypothetical protein